MATVKHSKKKDGRSRKSVSRKWTMKSAGVEYLRRHDRAVEKARREGPQSLVKLIEGVRERRRKWVKANLFAHHAIESAVELSLRGSVADPDQRFDIAYHTAEILADAVVYLVDIEAALRGRRLPLKRLLNLANNAIWHWPEYHVSELKKLLDKIPADSRAPMQRRRRAR